MIQRSCRSTLVLFARFLLHLTSQIVPLYARPEWLAEWTAELSYLTENTAARSTHVLAFVWGSFPDALTVRSLESVEGNHIKGAAFDSPAVCLATLSALVLSGCVLWTSGGRIGEFPTLDDALPHLLMIGLAVGVALIHNCTNGSTQMLCAAPGPRKALGFVFLFCKTMLALAIAALLTAAILKPLSSGTIHPHAYLFPYLFACRWSVMEQANRCPVCLHRTSHPTRIGTWPTLFLDWHGLEYICRWGHGFMYESIVIEGASFRRWAPLDPSWKDLFEPKTFRS